MGAARTTSGLAAVLVILACGPGSSGAERGAGGRLGQPTVVKYVRAEPLALPAQGRVGGIASDPAGTTYVGVTRGEETFVRVYDREGRFVREWLVDRRELVLRLDDVRLAVGPGGLVYVAPQSASSPDELIKVFTPTGTLVRTFGDGTHIREVTDIEVDAAGNTFLTSRARPGDGVPDDVVVKFDPDGRLAGRFAPLAGRPGQTANALRGLALAPDGSVYVSTESSDRPIVRLGPDGRDTGTVKPILGGTPDDVDFAEGRLYLAGDFRSRGEALVVVSLQGTRQEVLAGSAHYVAVAGRQLRLSGYDPPSALASHGGGAQTYAGTDVRVAPRIWHVSTGCFSTAQGNRNSLGVVVFTRENTGCVFTLFQRKEGLCPTGSAPEPDHVELGGETLPDQARPGLATIQVTPNNILIHISSDTAESGSILLGGDCVAAGGQRTPFWEWKGNVEKIDPSGNVFDRSTGRPVSGATVRLQFAPRRTGPFGVPGLSGITPQVNPQITGPAGFFGWDVAPGFWRLTISAFGYRAFTSPVYVVPPERKGLRLRLRPDPKQQAVLIDVAAARAGAARVGARPPRLRPSGLTLSIRRSRISSIAVRSARYRTVSGIRLGSTVADLLQAFPPRTAGASARLLAARATVSHRVGRTTFRLARGRVTSIVLAR